MPVPGLTPNPLAHWQTARRLLGATAMAWSGWAAAETASPGPAPMAWPQLLPLHAGHATDLRSSRCHAVLLSPSGERLGEADGSQLRVRLSVPFLIDSGEQPPASPLISFWMGDRSSSWGHYRSRGQVTGGFQSRRPHHALVLILQVKARSDCATAKGGLCEVSQGTLAIGHTPPDAPYDEANDQGIYTVTRAGPALPITLKEQCDAPDGKRFYDGLVAHHSILETAAGMLFVLMGGSR
jgi:hypothetical protein